MELKTAQALVRASQGTDSEIELSEGYSGRGMMGRTTTAVVFGSMPTLLVASAVASREAVDDNEFEDFCRDLQRLRFDNMGHDHVAY